MTKSSLMTASAGRPGRRPSCPCLRWYAPWRLEADQSLNLVILDMNGPGMSGTETPPRILRLRPDTHVLMATGYSDQEIAPLLGGGSPHLTGS